MSLSDILGLYRNWGHVGPCGIGMHVRSQFNFQTFKHVQALSKFATFCCIQGENRETRWKNARKVILKGKVGPSTKMKNIPLVFGTCSSTPCWGPVLGEVERDALSSGSR